LYQAAARRIRYPGRPGSPLFRNANAGAAFQPIASGANPLKCDACAIGAPHKRAPALPLGPPSGRPSKPPAADLGAPGSIDLVPFVPFTG